MALHESNAQHIIMKVETQLKALGHFELPQRAPAPPADRPDWEVWVVDASETPRERPKKPTRSQQWQTSYPYDQVPAVNALENWAHSPNSCG